MKEIYNPNPIISVFIEESEHFIKPVCYELIGKAKELASNNNMEIFATLPTNNPNLNLDKLKYLVEHIDIYQYSKNTNLSMLDYRDCLIDHINLHKPMIVLVGATALGRSFAPRVAAHFGTGITADCTELEFDHKYGLIQIRPAYGGDVIAMIKTPAHYPQMATVRPGVMEIPQYKNITVGSVQFHKINYIHEEINILKRKVIKIQGTKLENTDIVVLAGNAIKYPKQLEIIKQLAKLLGGEWAVTRPLVEGGLAPHDRQVGISGKTIHPKLVMAFGVSGTTQTLSGTSKAEKIISINNDENATIFKNSDIAILGDWEEIAKGIIKKLI